jgi:hypothetical protein
MHLVIKNSAKLQGETIKDFIMLAIKARLNASEYVKSNKALQEDIKNIKKFEKVKSIKDLF